MKTKLLLASAVLVLAGCKTTEPQYYYGNYSTAVYSFFKADEVGIEQQITALEETIQQAEDKGKPVAPGVHAHLGMLYFESGNAQMGMYHFELEKSLFPESTTYIEHLINSGKDA